MPEILIRKFTILDLENIIKIENRVFPKPWSDQAFLNCALWAEFWIASLSEKVVGYYVGQMVQQEAELHNIAVDPLFQKQGIGRQLLQHFLDLAKLKKIRDVFLQVRPSNDFAIQLYKKFGFVLSDRRPCYYEDNDEDALIFYKELDS